MAAAQAAARPRCPTRSRELSTAAPSYPRQRPSYPHLYVHRHGGTIRRHGSPCCPPRTPHSLPSRMTGRQVRPAGDRWPAGVLASGEVPQGVVPGGQEGNARWRLAWHGEGSSLPDWQTSARPWLSTGYVGTYEMRATKCGQDACEVLYLRRKSGKGPVDTVA